jgi:NADPH:quinone reductase-like Zn-dependent oxidoreductase
MQRHYQLPLGALMPHVITLSKPRFEVVSGISLHNNRTTPIPQRPEGILSTVSARPPRFHKLGGSEVLKIEDAPSQQPSKDEVSLNVRAIGLNRAESMFMHGNFLEPTQLPATLGYEASGIVRAIGPHVDPNWLDKRVSTMPAFSMNQYGVLGTEVIVPVHALAEYPSRLTAIEATAIWMQYMTACGALVEFGQVKKGEFILITAASSRAGLAAIQIAGRKGLFRSQPPARAPNGTNCLVSARIT